MNSRNLYQRYYYLRCSSVWNIALCQSHRELTDITLVADYIHLRFLDISGNHLKDVSPLSALAALLWLSADNNALSAVDVDELPHLQTASFRDNRLVSLAGISHPTLDTLSLAGQSPQIYLNYFIGMYNVLLPSIFFLTELSQLLLYSCVLKT